MGGEVAAGRSDLGGLRVDVRLRPAPMAAEPGDALDAAPEGLDGPDGLASERTGGTP
jgi:hypothetical protein